MKVRATRNGVILCALFLGVGGVVLSVVWRDGSPPVLRAYPRATQVCDRYGAPLRIILGETGMDCRPVALEQCSPWLAKALIAAEDKRFYRHRGIDLFAILRAVLLNSWHGRITSGASTITTQVVKMNQPASRTWRTKLREARAACQLETRMDKPAIIERYLNHVSLGGVRVGVESAALYYFGKHASDLSLAEAAALMGLPQAPSRLRPDRHIQRTHTRRHYVLGQMLKCGMITEALYTRTVSAPVEIFPRREVFDAPHFCDYILQQEPGADMVRSTLDRNIQRTIEEVLSVYHARLARQGIHGAAIVVIEVESGAVRAMVGSPDFFDAAHDGQYNCAVAPRSPGSALKPFVYAMAFDQAICMPGSMIRDEAMAYRQFVPENYDQTFSGQRTVREALVQSLNIPAVKVLERVGVRPFLQRLKSLGITTLTRGADHYGVGLALGGCEVTLLALCNAYACLARLGEYAPVRFCEEETPVVGARMFSKDAAYMMADILKDSARWGGIDTSSCHAPLPLIALKTGTSSGLRDAWSVAYNPEYVVGVWLGNPDGAPSEHLVGAQAAAPVARDIFRHLYPAGDSPWYARPASVVQQSRCTKTGRLAGRACETTYEDIGCTGGQVCMDCAAGRGRHEKIQIVSPAPGAQFRKVQGLPGVTQDVLLKARAPGSREVYWFINDIFYCVARADEAVYWPLEKGAWRITCSTDSGDAIVEVTVEDG